MISDARASGMKMESGPLGREERLRRLRRLQAASRLLDTALRVPGTNIQFGADSLLGLVPVVGDASGALIGLVIVNEARRLGVPRQKLIQMLYNLGLDSAIGAIPLLGDLFDVYFKSHRRNIKLILDHFETDSADLA